MYLPSDEGKWKVLEHSQAAVAVKELNGCVETVRGIDSFLELIPPWQLLRTRIKSSSHTSLQTKLLVECVHRRELSFYPDKELYRFSCVIDQIKALAGYERLAYLFAVGPTGQNSSGESNNWLLLDWASATIFSLNKQTNLELTKLEPEKIRDYLIFFCNFRGSDMDEDDTIAPFLIPPTIEDFGWEDTLSTLQEVAEKRHWKTFPLNSASDTSTADSPDLPEKNENQKPTGGCIGTCSDAKTEVISKNKIYEDIKKFFNLTNGNNTSQNPQLNKEEKDSNPVDCHHFDALVWHKNELLVTEFSVDLKEGVVREYKNPIPVAMELPMPRWVVRKDVHFIPLLCREQKRESVTAKELLERIQKHITAQASPVRLRGLRVIEGVKTAAEFAGPVVLENVEFMDDVILDDAIFKHSLHLIDCRFLRCLSAKNTVVEGAINLKDSYFYGAVQEVPDIADSIGEKYLPTIDLQSLNVESGFFADRVIIFGRVSVQWGRIQGGMRASGLQVYHRGNEIDGKAGLLDFSYMQVDGPLDLRGDIRTSRDPDRLQRTIIQGNVVMRGLRSYDVQLDGLRIDGDLDLQSCHITTALTMNVASCSDGDDCEVFWRPFIDGKFSAERAQIGTMDIRGCSIKKSLRLIGLKLADSFFARLDRRFRTQIGEDIVLSGAAIGGDIDLGGAKIERNFEYITGKCALLRMNPEPWMEPGKGQDKDILHFCETMASGVFLQDLHIDSGMDLTGIQLKSSNQSGNHGSSYASGSFIAHGIHLGGGLRFWREDGHLRLHDRVDRFLSSINKEKTEDLGKSIDEAIKKIKAYISNNLDLRGIHTADSINLGCCEVKGDICLENAHIGGSLRAYIEDETEVCEAQNFKADLAYIDGDADLRGMKVEGKLSAHNLQVNGNVLLACPDLKKNGQCAQIGDMIDFEGMHTEARLVLSSKNLIPKENNESSRIILARCNVGQLSIRDFKGGKTKPEFPHFMNLSAIQVGDWFLEEKKQVLALLEKTKPFDADNYIDIEHRLARIGDKKLADEVYRTMKNHVSDESSQVVSADLWERLLQGRDRLLNWLVRLPDWLNKLFSGHGTRPGWMVGWLIIWMLPVVYVLSDFRNVEFVLTVNCSYKVNEVQQAVGVSCSNKVNDVQQVVGVPYSNNEKYVLKESSWDLEKAIGLTMSYAIPFYGSRPDVVRARLIGGTCFWSPGASTNSPCNDLPISPHGFAMIFSIIQFILWIMIAANLPTIIRRRP